MKTEIKLEQLRSAQAYFNYGRIIRSNYQMWKALEHLCTGLSILTELEIVKMEDVLRKERSDDGPKGYGVDHSLGDF